MQVKDKKKVEILVFLENLFYFDSIILFLFGDRRSKRKKLINLYFPHLPKPPPTSDPPY